MLLIPPSTFTHALVWPAGAVLEYNNIIDDLAGRFVDCPASDIKPAKDGLVNLQAAEMVSILAVCTLRLCDLLL